jgi:hypothetical protein
MYDVTSFLFIFVSDSVLRQMKPGAQATVFLAEHQALEKK